MANINLLPWRDQYREEKKREFVSILVFLGIVAAAVAFIWVQMVNASIDSQSQRNQLLQTEITMLEKQVAEIKELKDRRTELIDRMKVIQDLQGKRPIIVRYFDEMVRAIPDGVFFNRLSRRGEVISIEGIAESNNRVSSLMRNLDASDWLASPNLTSVKDAPNFGENANEFKMTVYTSAPKDSTEAE